MDDKKRVTKRRNVPAPSKKGLNTRMEEVMAAGWCCYSDLQTRLVFAQTPSGFKYLLG
jgi:hypothetical protein